LGLSARPWRDGHDRIAAIPRTLVQRWAATRAHPADSEPMSELLQTLVPGLILLTVLTGHTPSPTIHEGGVF